MTPAMTNVHRGLPTVQSFASPTAAQPDWPLREGEACIAFCACVQDAGRDAALAMSEASLVVSTMLLSLWGEGLRAMLPVPEAPRSWYRHPDARTPDLRPTSWLQGLPWPGAPGAPFLAGWAGSNPFMAAFAHGQTWSPPWSPIAPMPLAIAAWLAQQPDGSPSGSAGLPSFGRAATAWPMAFALIAFGWPYTVARPAAAAGAALLDAGQIARASLERVMTSGPRRGTPG